MWMDGWIKSWTGMDVDGWKIVGYKWMWMDGNSWIGMDVDGWIAGVEGWLWMDRWM